MKKKIVGIIILMLLLATVIPAVASVENRAIHTIDAGHPLISRTKLPTTIPQVEPFQNNKINIRDPSHSLTSMFGGWSEKQKINIPDGATNYFGCDVAIDGDIAFIGAPGEDNFNGSVYVYTRTGATWTEQQKLTPSNPGVNDGFGVRIALQGDTALIGASDEISQDGPGAVYVFTRTGTTWTEQQILTPLVGDPFDVFCTPALDGDTAIVGAQFDDDMEVDAGALYVFTYTDSTWTQQAKLYAADAAAGEWFGFEVSLDGDTALTSTYDPGNDTVTPGAAYVFTRTDSTWTQQAKLVGSDTIPGDSFGYDVALYGDTAIVGAPNDDEVGLYSGSAFVFTRTGTTWTQQAKLLHSNGTQYDWLGCSVSLEGDAALIGAADEEEGSVEARGVAYVFTRSGTTWTEQQRLISSDGHRYDYFGWPVYLDGDTAFIGAYVRPYGQGPNTGSVYVFTKTDLTFSITSGLGVKVVITNNGTSDANDIPWQINVEGGILGLINKKANGTTDIPAGKSITVKTGIIFGFGAISIIAKVADEEKNAEGMQLFILSIVKK
jgi:hypothetical protein